MNSDLQKVLGELLINGTREDMEQFFDNLTDHECAKLVDLLDTIRGLAKLRMSTNELKRETDRYYKKLGK